MPSMPNALQHETARAKRARRVWGDTPKERSIRSLRELYPLVFRSFDGKCVKLQNTKARAKRARGVWGDTPPRNGRFALRALFVRLHILRWQMRYNMRRPERSEPGESGGWPPGKLDFLILRNPPEISCFLFRRAFAGPSHVFI
jgi:hypothetical protein